MMPCLSNNMLLRLFTCHMSSDMLTENIPVLCLSTCLFNSHMSSSVLPCLLTILISDKMLSCPITAPLPLEVLLLPCLITAPLPLEVLPLPPPSDNC